MKFLKASICMYLVSLGYGLAVEFLARYLWDLHIHQTSQTNKTVEDMFPHYIWILIPLNFAISTIFFVLSIYSTTKSSKHPV